jgi:hypothetical protein
MRGGIGRGNQAGVSHRILGSNIVRPEVLSIRTSIAPGLNWRRLEEAKVDWVAAL